MSLAPAIALALLVASGGDDHLVAGAAFFRDGRYAEALVEFRMAQRLGVSEAVAYAGATLVKLERPEEALEAFGESGSGGADSLLDYYRALAFHGAGLFSHADAILAGIGDRAGPKLAEQVSRIRADLAPKLAARPDPATLAWYRNRCQELRSKGRLALGDLFCQEASARERAAPRAAAKASPQAPPRPEVRP